MSRQKIVPSAKVKRYDFVKKPYKINGFFKWLSKLLAFKLLKNQLTIHRHNMEGLEPPYIVLSSHMSFLDFLVMLQSLLPHRNTNHVCALDAIKDYTEFLMRNAGIIGKRKFIKDLNLIRNIRYCLDELKTVLVMYPEAKYSLDGTTSYLPPSLGKLVKMMNVPVVSVVMNGNYVAQPQWNKKAKRTPLESNVTQIITKEDAQNLSQEELQRRIEESLVYDDLKWQKDNGIILDDPDRANGLNRLLYQCPHCKKEHDMYAEGTKLSCKACGKVWFMTELGSLKAENGETEFSHIPDWFDWQKQNIEEEIKAGKYYFEDTVRVETLPGAKRFYQHGEGKLTHSIDGFRLECVAYGEKRVIEWPAISINGAHIEYDYKGRGDAVDLSTHDDSYWLFPLNKRDVLTKISLATDIIFNLSTAKGDKCKQKQT